MQAYHIWSPGDPIPETLPEGCEYLNAHRVWHTETDVDNWVRNSRRWPAKPSYEGVVFGFLPTAEREKILVAHQWGRLEYHSPCGSWKHKEPTSDLLQDSVYRIKAQPSIEITVSINGKPAKLSDISAETLKKLQELS